jgi:hypothetical protein
VPKTGGNSIQTILKEYSEDIVLDSPIQKLLSRYGLRSELKGGVGKRPYLTKPKQQDIDKLILVGADITCRGIDLERILRRFKFPVDSNKNLLDDIDFLLRFESLDEYFRILCDKLDIPYVPLPFVNISKREHYSHYYDEELKELARRKFAEEIEFGKYQFEDFA